MDKDFALSAGGPVLATGAHVVAFTRRRPFWGLLMNVLVVTTQFRRIQESVTYMTLFLSGYGYVSHSTKMGLMHYIY